MIRTPSLECASDVLNLSANHVGTINGSGNYGFLLSAIDGAISGGGGTDKFRIKIWDKNNNDAVVYDNQPGAADNADATTVVNSGGSIVIHP